MSDFYKVSRMNRMKSRVQDNIVEALSCWFLYGYSGESHGVQDAGDHAWGSPTLFFNKLIRISLKKTPVQENIVEALRCWYLHGYSHESHEVQVQENMAEALPSWFLQGYSH